jgi:hypothetical protein
MTHISYWPTTSVSTFFSDLPWYGRVAQAVLTEEPLQSQKDLRLLSVQEFFVNISWNGRVSHSETGFEQNQELSYLLSVRDFWSRVTWQGRPQIAAVQTLNVSQSNTQEIDLNDLANLF